jgi:WD40 repeat protein/tetratricopeptide (TPR) repeat protein
MDGQEVETAGDSFLAVFAAPSEGVRFALHFHAAMRRARGQTPELPEVRVGIHQGQVVVERHADGPKAIDIYGLQVSVAARITELAQGGQVLCSRAVFDDARAILRGADLAGLSSVAWRNHGPYRFRGVEDAYDVCEVGEEGAAPLSAPPASAKGWPAGQGEEELGWRPAAGVAVPGTNWVLEERLGREKEGPRGRFRGEFGEVWRAWNPSDKSRQVFKFCFRRDRVPALKREARLLKRLSKYRHPNLVEVYDVTEGGRPPYYLEMEYVEGPSLEEWLATDPSLSERLEIIAQVADALDTVHAAGIYHRDIKPSNILLTRREDGALQAKLSDFGLGASEDKELLKSIYASRVEGVAGTWDYIAPELRTGGKATAQSDLFSLGVTLFQAAAGDVRRPLGDWEREVPSEVLREDIRRCLAHEPGERWGRAAELATALRGHDQRLRELDLEREREQHRRRVRRLRLVAAVLGAFAAVVLTFGGVALHQRQEARAQRKVAQAERDSALEGANAIIEKITSVTKGHVPGYTQAQIDLIYRAQAVYDRLMSHMPDREDILDSKAKALTSLASAYRLLGDTEKAKRATEELLTIRSRLSDSAPRDTERLWHLARALLAAAAVRRETQDYKGSADAFEQLVDKLERLRSHAPQDCDWARAIPLLQLGLESDVKALRGLPTQDQESTRRKLRQLVNALPWDTPTKLASFRAVVERLEEGNIVSIGLRDALDPKTGEFAGPKSMRPASPEEIAKEARRLVHKAESLATEGDHAEARRCFEQGVKKLRGLVEKDPENAPYRQLLADALLRFSEFQYVTANDPKGAMDSCNEADRIYQRLLDGGAREGLIMEGSARVLMNLTTLHWEARKESDVAAKCNARAKAILEGILSKVAGQSHELEVTGFYLRCLEREAELKGQPADPARVLGYYERLTKQFEGRLDIEPGDAESREALAQVAFTIGDLKWKKSDYPGARTAWERCVELRRQLATAEPANPERLDDLGKALFGVAGACQKLGDSAAYLKHTTDMVATRRRLCALNPANEEWHKGLASALRSLYYLRRHQGDRSAGREWLGLCRRWHDADPADADWKDSLTTASWYLAIDLRQEGAHEDALPLLTESAELSRQLLAEQPRQAVRLQNHAVTLRELVQCNKELGLRSRALAPCIEGLAVWRLAVKEEPDEYRYVKELSHAASEAAELHLFCRNNTDDALACAQEGITLLQDYGARHPAETEWRKRLVNTYDTLATVRKARMETAAAVAAYEAGRDALREQRAAPGDLEPGVVLCGCLTQLAGARLSHGDASGAAKALQHALETAAALAEAHPENKLATGTLDIVQRKIQDLGTLDEQRETCDELRRAAAAAPADLGAQRRFYRAANSLMRTVANLLDDRATRELQAEILPLARQLASQVSVDKDLLENVLVTTDFIARYREQYLDMKGGLEARQAFVDMAKKRVASSPSSYRWHRELAGQLGNVAKLEVDSGGDSAGASAAYEALLKVGGDLLSLPLPEGAKERAHAASVLNEVARDLITAELKDMANKDQMGRQLAQKACEATQWQEGAIIDTLAHAHFNLGETDRAVELQKKAVDLCPEDKHLRRFLEKLIAAKEEERAVKELRVFRGHRSAVEYVAFVAGGQRVASFTFGVTQAMRSPFGRAAHIPCRVWDRETGEEVLRFGPEISGFAAIARDGKRALTAGSFGLLQLWDLDAGHELRRLQQRANLGAVALLPGGQQCLFAVNKQYVAGEDLGVVAKDDFRDDFRVRVWDLKDNREIASFKGHNALVWRMDISPDGRRALSQSCGLICLWQVEDAKELWRQQRESWEVNCIGFSWDGRRVLVGDSDGVVRVCDAESGKEVQTLRQDKGRKGVSAAAFSPDGRRLLAGYRDNTLRLWDTESGKEIHCCERHVAPVLGIAFSEDGKYALSGSEDTTVRVWRLPE